MKSVLRSNTFAFLLIVLAHVLYKTVYLDHWGFWHDEAFSLYFSQQHWGHIKHISEWDFNPPLYYYFLWIWQHLFGIGEYAVRFSSVLFSALSAGMLYLLGARHGGRMAGWLAVIFFTLSGDMYYYAQEARPYALVAFLVLCSSWFFLELARKPGWLNAIALGFLNFGLIYTHYLTVSVILVQIAVLLLFFNRPVLKFFSVAMGLTILISLLRFTKKTVMLVFDGENAASWIRKPGISELADTFYGYFNGPDLFFIFLFAAFVPLVYLVQNKAWKPFWSANKLTLSYVIGAGAGSILLCFALSQAKPMFVRAHLLFAGPFIYLTVAWFISLAQENIRYPLYALAGVFMFFSLLRIDLKTPRPMDYRNAMHFVKALQDTGMPVLVETPDVAPLFAYYYDRKIFADYENMQGRLRDSGVYPVRNAADARNANIEWADRIVLTQSFEDGPGDKDLLRYLSKKYKNRAIYTQYRGITVNLFWKDPISPRR